MLEPIIIKGNVRSDFRGKVGFINEFDMLEVRRFYTIENESIDIERGWRGHKIEQRWLSVCKGTFIVKLVKIDNWETPDQNLEQLEFILQESQFNILHIPIGYASLLKANEINSKMILFADSLLADAYRDDYLFPTDYFIDKK